MDKTEQVLDAILDAFQQHINGELVATDRLDALRKQLEIRVDALSVVGRSVETENALVRALKRLKSDILCYE